MAEINFENTVVRVGETTPAESVETNVVLGAGTATALNPKAEGNTAVGAEALLKDTTGVHNTVVGAKAGRAITTGGDDTAVGWDAMVESETAKENVAIGRGVSSQQTTGSKNTAVGYIALNKNQTAIGNTVVGCEAAELLLTGNSNTIVGAAAGRELEGEKNILLGLAAGEKAKVSNTLIIANNPTKALIEGVMSATEANQEIGFLGHAPVKRQKVTGNKTTEIPEVLKNICKALGELGLITDETT